MNENTSLTQNFDLEEEYELDLLKLVSTDANDLNQYLVFKGSNDEWYGVNVSKIEEVMVYDKSIEIVKNTDKESVIYGTADIRNVMTTLLYYDDWYGNTHLDDSEYELIILLNYGGYKLGTIVKEVSTICTIEVDQMSDNSLNDAKTTFVAKALIEGHEQMCTIYDGDKMILDIFGVSQDQQDDNVFSRETIMALADKRVFFADDSKFVRRLVEQLFIKFSMQYKIFNDGQLLIEHLQTHPTCEVDLFITDLEMPNMGGREVISIIREQSKYDDVSILVHTNMSNSIMETELLKLGASRVIAKMNMLELSEVMQVEIKA